MFHPRIITAGLVALILAVLTCVQVYYEKHPAESLRTVPGGGKDGVSVFGFMHDMDVSNRTIKVRWEVVNRDIIKDTSIAVDLLQPPFSSDNISIIPDAPPHGAQRFVLHKGAYDVHPVTDHILDGSWNPSKYPFDRYTFSGRVFAFNYDTGAPIAVSAFGIADNMALKHFTPVFALKLGLDKEIRFGEHGCDHWRNERASAQQTFGFLVERTVLMKVLAIGRFVAGWVLTLGMMAPVVSAFWYGRKLDASSMLFSSTCVILGLVAIRALEGRDGVPVNHPMLFDYVGLYLQVALVAGLTLVVVVVQGRASSRGAIYLDVAGDDE